MPARNTKPVCPDHPSQTWINFDGSRECAIAGCPWGWIPPSEPLPMGGYEAADHIRDLLRRVEALEAINRGRRVALEILAAREPLDWYLSQLGDA